MLDCLPSEMYVLYFSFFLTKVLPLVNRGCYGSISVSSFLLVSPLAIFPFNRHILRWNNRLGSESIFFHPFYPLFPLILTATRKKLGSLELAFVALQLPFLGFTRSRHRLCVRCTSIQVLRILFKHRWGRRGKTVLMKQTFVFFFLIFIRLDFVFCELNSRIFRWFSRRDFRI